jgi:aldose sugar dehydrogenase
LTIESVPIRLFVLLAPLAFAAMSACGSASAPGASAPITVRGIEHFAWNQQADSLDEVANYTFVAYVDDAPLPLPDAACASGSTAAQFDCSARLPSMSAGAHRVQLASAVFVDGVRFESPRSTALNVVVVPTSSGNVEPAADSRLTLSTADGTTFAVETLARGLDAPSGLAASPDGRVFIAERAGTVKVWKEGRLQDTPALRLSDAVLGSDTGLLGIAIHPEFAKNSQVYVAYMARAGDDRIINRIVRFRELADTLGQAAVVLEDVAASAPQRAPRIQFGPDGKMYVAFPVDAATAKDPATYVGKILRLNDDGTTPRDNPGYSPILTDAEGVPLAFSWQPATGTRWQIDRDWTDQEMLLAPRRQGDQRRVVGTHISPAIDPSGASFYDSRAIGAFSGDLFISALAGRQIQRVRFDPTDPARVVATEPLLTGTFGRIGDIVAGPDGALYFCTSNRGLTDQPASGDDDRLVRIAPMRVKETISKVK